MIGIKCKSGPRFQLVTKITFDAEWKYKKRIIKRKDCEVELSDEVRFSECHNCEHYRSLEHNLKI
jgi:hypothetical protein